LATVVLPTKWPQVVTHLLSSEDVSRSGLRANVTIRRISGVQALFSALNRDTQKIIKGQIIIRLSAWHLL
jgi:hypothetical protein